MNQGAGQGQSGGRPHGGQDRIEVVQRPAGRRRARAVDRRRRAQAQFQRSQGVPGGGIDEQGAGQFIAAVGTLAKQELIGLAGMAVVVEDRPVMDEQGVVGRGIIQGRATCCLQGFDEGREGDAVIGEEAPGSLGAGKGRDQAWQRRRTGGERRRATQVFVDQVDVAALQPRLKCGHGKLIPLLYA